MNKERKLVDRHGEEVRIGDTVKWQQESGNKLIAFTGKIESIDDYIRIETSKGDIFELLWPYDLPDAQIEKINSSSKR